MSVQPVYVRLAEILQAQFAEIGITMKVEQNPQLADAFFVQNAYDAIVSAVPRPCRSVGDDAGVLQRRELLEPRCGDRPGGRRRCGSRR